MTKKQFVPIVLGLIAVNLVIKAIFIFGIDLQVQNRVGSSAYGLYFTLLNLCYLFQVINDFGLHLLHTTDTARHGIIRRERFRQILSMKIRLSLVYSGLIIGIAWILGYGYAWKLLLVLIANNILISYIAVLRAGISGVGQYKTEAFLSVLDKLLMILICGVLLLQFDTFHMEWFVWAQLASLIITLVAALWLNSKHTTKEEESEEISLFTGSILKSAFPFALGTLLMFGYTRVDSILLEQLLPEGAHQAGIYAGAYRLLDAANMIAFLFTPLLVPMYARLQSNRDEILQLIRVAGGMMLCLVVGVSLLGFWWGEPIMHMLYRESDAQWIATFQWLILCHIPIGLMYVFGSYLTATGMLKQQNILFVFSVFLNIGLNFLVIPYYGTIGAAGVALITQCITTAGLIILANARMNARADYKFWLNLLGFLVVSSLTAPLLASTSMVWMMECAIFIFCVVFAAFVFRLLEWNTFLQLVKSYVSLKKGS